MLNSTKHFIKLPSLLLVIIFVVSGCAGTQQTATDSERTEETALPLPSEMDRPVPNSIDEEIPNAFYEAIDKGTRTETGVPGDNYWQQWTNYDIDVELIPGDTLVKGSGTITYFNNSPDTLNQLVLELSQNLHKEGVQRNMSQEVTGGVNLYQVNVNGEELGELQSRFDELGYAVEGTQMVIAPGNPVAPGDSVTIQVDWDFKVPQQGASGRMGYSEDNLFYIGYWYPKMRVYDDVIGWFTDPFTGNAEFYNGFGDYEVDITAPEQWMIAATGELHNPEEVLRDEIYNRLQEGHSSDSIVNVVTEEDFGNVTKTGDDGKVTWNFTADKVRDFAFSATTESMWDATRTNVGDLDGDGQDDYSDINAIYRSSAPLWTDGAEFTSHAISFLSEYTGLNYPWPHMTSVEGGGIIGGGMEFPMMTVIGDYNGRPSEALYSVIAHELAHMWVPMQISNNERRYAWMDEGTTSFNTSQAKKAYYPDGGNFDIDEIQSYLQITNTDLEGPIMRWSDYHYNGFAYGVASYPKPASLLASLRGILGEETFNEALQTFFSRWQYKHPYPWDLFNTFEDVSGRDLDWFWRSWYYEVWTLDQAIANVTETNGEIEITVEDLGEVPMPTTVEITLQDGSTIREEIPVETWLKGATETTITVETDGEVKMVEIDPDLHFADTNRENNIWQK